MSDNYVNVGAKDESGIHLPTKKSLINIMKLNPEKVTFYPTAMFGSQSSIRGDEIPENTVLQVCGPDPATSRKWFASVRKTRRGISVT